MAKETLEDQAQAYFNHVPTGFDEIEGNKPYTNPDSTGTSELEEEKNSTSESRLVPTHSVVKTDNETETTAK